MTEIALDRTLHRIEIEPVSVIAHGLGERILDHFSVHIGESTGPTDTEDRKCDDEFVHKDTMHFKLPVVRSISIGDSNKFFERGHDGLLERAVSCELEDVVGGVAGREPPDKVAETLVL